MKKLKVFVIFFVLVVSLFMPACGKQTLNQPALQRDNQHIGGNLSFEYDNQTHTAYFGGEGQYIEFYDIDIARDFQKKGNRIGIKVTAPLEVDDFDTGIATAGDEKIEGGEFYSQVDGKKTREAVFYPIIKKDQRVVNLNIVWQDGIKEQCYKIVIKDGTKFVDEKSKSKLT